VRHHPDEIGSMHGAHGWPCNGHMEPLGPCNPCLMRIMLDLTYCNLNQPLACGGSEDYQFVVSIPKCMTV
jgi:hypothetical protein